MEADKERDRGGVCVCMYTCICVCVCVREGEKRRRRSTIWYSSMWKWPTSCQPTLKWIAVFWCVEERGGGPPRGLGGRSWRGTVKWRISSWLWGDPLCTMKYMLCVRFEFCIYGGYDVYSPVYAAFVCLSRKTCTLRDAPALPPQC